MSVWGKWTHAVEALPPVLRPTANLHLKGQTQNGAFLLTLKSDNFNMLYKNFVGHFELTPVSHILRVRSVLRCVCGAGAARPIVLSHMLCLQCVTDPRLYHKHIYSLFLLPTSYQSTGTLKTLNFIDRYYFFILKKYWYCHCYIKHGYHTSQNSLTLSRPFVHYTCSNVKDRIIVWVTLCITTILLTNT